jgi:hypothetical protein
MKRTIGMLIVMGSLFGGSLSFAGYDDQYRLVEDTTICLPTVDDKGNNVGETCIIPKRAANHVDYTCRGTGDGKNYPVRLDLGNKTLTWFNLRFGNVRQVDCDAMACYQGTHKDLVGVLSTATQGVADFEIQSRLGRSTFECRQHHGNPR